MTRTLAIRLCTLALASLLPGVATSQDISEALPEHLIYLYSVAPDEPPQSARRQLFAGQRRWEVGRVLRVCMFGGNEVVSTLVREAASEWNNYSGVKFDFGPEPQGYNCLSSQTGYFQIRIGFSSPGYWSAVGNDSEMRMEALSPSMNFQGFNRLYSPGRMSATDVVQKAERSHIATIKHELGHALGLLHEHQNPSLGCREEIKWEGPGNVYDYYAAPPNSWTAEQVDRNMGFVGQTDPDYVSQESDRESIMMYALAPAILKRGAASPCFTAARLAISNKDKQVVARIYPTSATPVRQPSDVDFRAATVRTLSPQAAPVEIQDTQERILVDLESNDTFTRRNARARLADLLVKLPVAQATELIKRTSTGSYRLQLGTAVAVAKAPAGLQLSPEAKAILLDRSRNARDSSLRQELSKAARR